LERQYEFVTDVEFGQAVGMDKVPKEQALAQSSGKTAQLGVTPLQLPGTTQEIAAFHPASEIDPS
jgi:hypothetical protein